ncbi:5,10-methylene tetrahydromethanopterin reductase [Brachybacterium endophyticum]|uniref:5,10-methylene tetrahydromethanopterin reductase n=1 Tax=Brachybacterium endophyticum TaxID=2182385 RepID=A0A2U2RI47_9MICO|nr:LLM class flavin-dependent oxidoreductase [Brachybacterium endophyticum]PWH05562.1 5,10-methylene tetrahydromethanopterin reductase [Brachybacterium endophyticum]
MTSRPLLLNAFDMLTPVHQSPGLWRHPESRVQDYDRLEYWTDLARTLEEGGFASMFLADVVGVYDVYGGGPDAAARGGVQYPLLDPLVAVPAMAAVTRHLGFGVTASVSYEEPYLLARTLTTLDHFTGGRVAWNIVTSYQDSAARNLGRSAQIPHDERYDRADEYMEVMYELFEGSFADGAVRFDRDAGVVVDPGLVRDAEHHGRHFDVPGRALAAPGPQRTPFLFQAGASSRGLRFAREHAEAIFFSGGSPSLVRSWVDSVRDGLEEAGRSRDAAKVFALATIVVDETDEAAEQRLEEYREWVDTASALTLFGGWTGVDLSSARPDDPIEHVRTDANQSALDSFTTLAGDRRWTVADLAEFVAIGGRGPVIVGSPSTVADELERWAREADIDGFNVSAAVRPADFERVARLVSPELRRRGVLAEPVEGTAPRTLRERLGGDGPHLAADHPGATRRFEA